MLCPHSTASTACAYNIAATLWGNGARSGQTAGGTPLLESFDVRVGEQQCAMRNVGLARLVEHEAQDVLDLRRATAFGESSGLIRLSFDLVTA